MILDSRYHLTGTILDSVHPKEFGELQSGYRLLDQEPLWFRSIDLMDLTLAIKERLSILRRLDHPCLLRCYAVLAHRGIQYIVLESPGEQTVLDYLRSPKWLALTPSQQSNQAAAILTQIAQVIQYLDQMTYTLAETNLSQIRIKDSPDPMIQISGYGVLDRSSRFEMPPRESAQIGHLWTGFFQEIISHLTRIDSRWAKLRAQSESGHLGWQAWLADPISSPVTTLSKPMTMPSTPNLEQRVNSASPLGWSNLSRSKPAAISSSCPTETEFDFYLIGSNSH